MNEVVIAGYLRTAQSRSRPGEPGRDWLHQIRADDLLAKILTELIERAGIAPGGIDDFIVGCAQGFSENYTVGGRTPLFLANLPAHVPAKFVDQQCGSSMAAVHIGMMEIQTGNADVVLAGGMEHMTRVPMGAEDGTVKINNALYEADEYAHWDMATSMNMGLTAEKLLSASGLTRIDTEQWALRSHKLAAQAQEDGFFDGEILPIEAPQQDGSTLRVDKDQAVRPSTSMEALAGLKPAYVEGGKITAGTSSPLSAGATAMLLMSPAAAEKNNITPLATIRSIGFAGVDPTIMGSGPVPASRKALAAAGLTVADIDYWEINEAFGIVALHCIKELGIDPETVNIFGGALAIGHPLGATGIRLVGTLARILNRKNGRYGLANACVGGGQGVATIIERIA